MKIKTTLTIVAVSVLNCEDLPAGSQLRQILVAKSFASQGAIYIVLRKNGVNDQI